MIAPLHDLPPGVHYRHQGRPTIYHRTGNYDAVTPAMVEVVDPPADCPVCATDPLQRHLLCQATGCHDDDGHGTCRDCGKRLSVGDDVAYAKGSIL